MMAETQEVPTFEANTKAAGGVRRVNAARSGEMVRASLERAAEGIRGFRLWVTVTRLEYRLKRDPENTGALSRLAGVYEGAGRRQDAVVSYQRLSAVYRKRRDASGLAFIVRKLETLGATDIARVYRDLAMLFCELGRHSDAARACKRVVEIYLAEGHTKAATGYLTQLPALGPLAAETRGEIEQMLGLVEPPPTVNLPPARKAGTGSLTGPLRAPKSSERKTRELPVFLSGTIGRISVFDVVQMIETNLVTGQLLLDVHGIRDAGTLHFDAGRIVSAQFGSLRGVEAARRLLQVEEGPFRVEVEERPHADELRVATNTGFLLDLLREIDELQHRPIETTPETFQTSPLIEEL